jgi:hypothetical protein
MPPTITVDFGKSPFPALAIIAQDLGIEYDDDTGSATTSDGQEFIMDCYPKAGYVRFDSPDEIPDSAFTVILAIGAADARVLIQEDEYDEGVSLSLIDFQEALMEDDE